MKRRDGFTLIELLVVIAIIALLMAVIMPSLKAAKERAREVVCKSHQNQIGKAAQAYAMEYNNVMCGAEVTGINWASSNPYTGNWQVRYAPYVGGTSADIKDIWDIGVYNCPSYPNKSGEQTQDYVVNAWRFVAADQNGTELRGDVRINDMRNTGTKIHLSEYAYSRWTQDTATNKWVNTGDLLQDSSGNGVQIITPDDIRSLSPENLYKKMRWLDVRGFNHLANAPVEQLTRRVSRGRHKKTGTNNLFFDGHVEWLDAEDNDARKWWIKQVDPEE